MEKESAPTGTTARSSSLATLQAVASFLLPFIAVYEVYHVTLFPSIAGGDSGELMAEACVGGVPHPPGYPLYTLLSQAAAAISFPRFYYDAAFSAIRFKYETTNAWRVNHMCCVFGSVAAGFVSSAVYTALPGHPCRTAAGWAAAGLFAFSPLVWEYSIGGEVFALNNAICAAIVCIAMHLIRASVLAAADSSSPSSHTTLLSLGALCAGLALSNQHSSLLLLIFAVPLLWYRFRKEISGGVFLQLVCFGSLGLSPYAYIFYSAKDPKQGSWGDTSSMLGLLRHVTRAEYGTFQLGIIKGSEGAISRIFLYLKHLSAEHYHVVLPLIVLSLYHLGAENPSSASKGRVKTSELIPKGKGCSSKKSGSVYRRNQSKDITTVEAPNSAPEVDINSTITRACLQFVLTCWVGYVLVWHSVFSNLPLHAPMPFAVHSRFWMQPNILSSVLSGVGVAVAFGKLFNLMIFRAEKASLLTVSILLVSIVSSRVELLNHSVDGWIMHSYGEYIIRSVTKSASDRNELLLSHTDLDWNSVRYVRTCERVGTYSPNVNSEPITHLNFQLMPYPWFPTNQEPLYDDVNFPPILPSVSTSKLDPNNAALVARFCSANLNMHDAKGSGNRNHLFLDMQAVNEREILSGGIWSDFLLISWGLVYKVVPKVSLHDSGYHHGDSLNELEQLQVLSFLGILLHWKNNLTLSGTSNSVGSAQGLRAYQYDTLYNLSIANLDRGTSVVENKISLGFNTERYPPGSWEWAAASVYMDAHYQFGLVLLSFAMEFPMKQHGAAYGFVVSIDRLVVSSELLGNTLVSVEALGGPLSSAVRDLEKNVVTANMRLYASVEKAVKFQSTLINELNNWDDGSFERLPLLTSQSVLASHVLTKAYQVTVAKRSIEFFSKFLTRHPDDRDHKTFSSVLGTMKNFLLAETSK